MRPPTLSERGWRRLVALLAALALTLLANELRHAIPLLADGYQGSLGVVLDDGAGLGPAGRDSQLLRVRQVAPGALPAQGVRSGTLLRFERRFDRWRRFEPGEAVPLLIDDGPRGTRRIVAYATRTPVGFADYVDYLGRWLLSLPALAFCLLIASAQAGGRAYRRLALCFLAMSLNAYYTFSYAPPGPAQAIAKLANLLGYPLIWYLAAGFALRYQPYDATRLRRLLWRALPGYRLLTAACVLYALWFGLGHDAPGLSVSLVAGVGAGLAIATASLLDGLRQTRGNLRMRHIWLLLSFAFGAIPSALTLVPALTWNYQGMRYVVIGSFAGQFAMYLGLAYAVLRHRVFEFDLRFLFGRVTVLSVASVLLFAVFGAINHLLADQVETHHELVEADHDLLGALMVLPLFYPLARLQEAAEKSIDRMLFQAAHHRERALAAFVRRAIHYTAPAPLLAALVEALGRYGQGAGVAVYLACPEGGFRLAGGTLAQAPAQLGFDPALCGALARGPAACGDTSAADLGELGLPMYHRGALHGVVLLGRKGGKDGYRPDERALLADAVQQVGLDLDTLHVEALEARVDALTREADLQDIELHMFAGRRHGLRSAQG